MNSESYSRNFLSGYAKQAEKISFSWKKMGVFQSPMTSAQDKGYVNTKMAKETQYT